MTHFTMHRFLFALLAAGCSLPVWAQTNGRGPINLKAQKTYAEAKDQSRRMSLQDRLDKYRKADKQDDNHCYDCAQQAAELALKLGNNDQARDEAVELEGLASTPVEHSDAYFLHGVALLNAGLANHKERNFAEADEALGKSLAINGATPYALYEDGMALAYLHQDDAARARFRDFFTKAKPGSVDYVRAQRYIQRPELARARMAPAFAITTMDSQRVSLDGLEGKVLLLDFWATWCGPCREALPRIQDIAKRFAGQPLVVLSISLDSDDAKWRSFVTGHNYDVVTVS